MSLKSNHGQSTIFNDLGRRKQGQVILDFMLRLSLLHERLMERAKISIKHMRSGTDLRRASCGCRCLWEYREVERKSPIQG